jgi:hypothetical protein
MGQVEPGDEGPKGVDSVVRELRLDQAGEVLDDRVSGLDVFLAGPEQLVELDDLVVEPQLGVEDPFRVRGDPRGSLGLVLRFARRFPLLLDLFHR